MGNSSWGKGYHQGLGDGRRQGSTYTVVATLAAGLLVAGGRRGYEEIQKRLAAKQERRLVAEPELGNGEDYVSKDDWDK